MFIGNFMAQYELFIRCMHFNTIRNKLTFNLGPTQLTSDDQKFMCRRLKERGTKVGSGQASIYESVPELGRGLISA